MPSVKQERFLSALPTILALLGFSAGLCFCRITGYYADLPLPAVPAFGASPAAFIGAFLSWLGESACPLFVLYLAGYTCFAVLCGCILLPWQGFLYGTVAACLGDGTPACIACCAVGALLLLFYVNMCRIAWKYAALPVPSPGLLARGQLPQTRLYNVQAMTLSGMLVLLQLLLFTLSFFGVF